MAVAACSTASLERRRARTEVTDQILIFGQRHLRTILAQYAVYYNGRRLHRSCQPRPPRPDYLVPDHSQHRRGVINPARVTATMPTGTWNRKPMASSVVAANL